MAVELVLGSLLSSSFQYLIERIGSGEALSYLRRKSKSSDIDQQFEKLKNVLNNVMAVMEDAEQKQRKSKSVELWLDELQEAVFDAEDFFDGIETEAMVSVNKKQNAFKKMVGKLSGSSNTRNMESVKELLRRFEEIAARKDSLGLINMTNQDKASWRFPSTSLVDESEIYGRDIEKEEIIKSLLSDNEKACVISIVGMGGVGKTTIAQVAYNDEKVKESFEIKAWVCVSEEFDIYRVTKAILEEVTPSACGVTELNSLQVKLKEGLSGKKFLIVLDDVWHEKPTDLDVLCLPFKDGAQGSKVIVTTRNVDVASAMRSIHTHNMNKLSEDASWKLFVKEAFGINNELDSAKELERIGREIVKKCDGLPLALKTLGGLLRSTKDVGKWRRILESDIWDLREVESDILPALKLSYHYLPSQLKRCFGFCSIFPSDYGFRKDELILLWMAENFLDCPNNNRRIEDVGEEYFIGLVSRSFFQRSNKNESIFVMHDLIHDLAKSISTKYCLHLEDGMPREFNKNKLRHLGYSVGEVDSYKRFCDVLLATNLRTFLPQSGKDIYEPVISTKAIADYLLKMRCLRVLSLSEYNNVAHLPDSIGELRLLRYLDVSFTKISLLPDSVCNLFNLQTLKLQSCWCLKNLPADMHHLSNLRHLDIRDCRDLKEVPKQLSKLTKLQTLSTFIVGKENGTKIGELGTLSDLRGKLCIRKLENVGTAKSYFDDAKLIGKDHLESVSLEWSDDSNHSSDVLEMLKPNIALKELSIDGYGGIGFPKCFGTKLLDNIVSLILSGCKNCTSLPSLGQLPSLKILYISNLDALVDIGPEFYGDGPSVIKSFQSLEILKISNMKTWETWSHSDTGAFSRLIELDISHCHRFKGDLPSSLASLKNLSISDCKNLNFSLPNVPCVRELIVSGCKNMLQGELSIIALKLMESCEIIKLAMCSSLIQIPVSSLPSTLTKLEIEECSGLEIRFDSPHMLLEDLSICNCEAFESLPLDYFPKLKKLRIKGSKRLESLSTFDDGPQSKGLKCPNFVAFPIHGLSAANLTSLEIKYCQNLKSWPEKMHNLLTSLKTLTLRSCPQIASFPQDGLPSSLMKLVIYDCKELVATRKNWGLKRLPNLTYFRIKGSNEDVESFPEEGLLPITITTLHIFRFPSLKSLDEKGLRQLTSLEKLLIDSLPKLQTIQVQVTSLKYLYIWQCDELQTVSKDDLPTSLEYLTIWDCRKVNLVKGLPASLKGLIITGCDELKGIEADRLLSSLQRVSIDRCPNLKTIPDSLQSLEISECPLLEKKCKPKKGEYRRYIAHIPKIKINEEYFVA